MLSGCTIEANYSNAGGLIGEGYNVNMNNNYARFSIKGKNYLGGLIGKIYTDNNDAEHSIIKNHYVIGSIISTSNDNPKYIGAIAPTDYVTDEYLDKKSVDLQNSYYNISVTNGKLDTSLGGEEKTLDELKQKSTFKNWDFDNVWGITDGVTEPQLRPNAETEAIRAEKEAQKRQAEAELQARLKQEAEEKRLKEEAEQKRLQEEAEKAKAEAEAEKAIQEANLNATNAVRKVLVLANAGVDISESYQIALVRVNALQDQTKKAELLQLLGDAKAKYDQSIADAEKAEKQRRQEEAEKAKAVAEAEKAYKTAYSEVVQVELSAAKESTVSAEFLRSYQSALAKVNALTHAAQKSMLLSRLNAAKTKLEQKQR